VRRPGFGERHGRRNDEQRKLELDGGVELVAHQQHRQYAACQHAGAAFQAAGIGALGEERPRAVGMPAEAHAHGLGQPVAQPGDQDRDEDQRRLVVPLQPEEHRDEHRVSGEHLGDEPQQRVRPVLRAIERSERGCEKPGARTHRPAEQGYGA
jgi:hypothetical protein